jgi:hypothetical protein
MLAVLTDTPEGKTVEEEKRMIPNKRGEENVGSFNRYSRREDC